MFMKQRKLLVKVDSLLAYKAGSFSQRIASGRYTRLVSPLSIQPSIASALSEVYHLKADDDLFRSDDRTLFEGCYKQYIDRYCPIEDLQAPLFSTETFHAIIFIISPTK